MKYRRYRVQAHDRGPLMDFVLDSLETAGCTIIRHTPASEAPFRIALETPMGERMGIIAYAFYANARLTKNRPEDEWRFQVKYGSKDGRPHEIWQDPFGLYTTLFFGINPDTGIFVGADPEIHNPTKFFVSIELKQAQVDAILRQGWHTWERDRRQGDLDPVEVLVGGTRASLLQYLRFERVAHGLDQGHRQLLAEKMPEAPRQSGPELPMVAPPHATMHALAREFEMTETAVLDLIASARRLKMAVRGWVAEEHLVRVLGGVNGVTDCRRSDEEGGPDVTLRYLSSRTLAVQCKNVLRNRAADGSPRLDFQRTRASKGDPCSRFYRVDEYDLVAACLHAVTERWEFRYALPVDLDPHKSGVSRRVDGDCSIDGGQPIDLIRDSGRLFRCEPYRGGCSSSWFLVP
ncbi:MAG: hypothetical protein V2A73_10080, partial [Pseudomonadota bacterium]